MWLIPFCHQWILKIFSCSVKLFINHNGGTVEIRFNFQDQEVAREFKWGIVSSIPHKTSRFLRDLHHFVEKNLLAFWLMLQDTLLYFLHAMLCLSSYPAIAE